MNIQDIVPGAVFRHFKGFVLVVTDVVKHTETGEILVVYTCTNGDKDNLQIDGTFARPIEMFMSEVDHKKYPNVTQKYRFVYLGYVVYNTTDIKTVIRQVLEVRA